MIEDQPEEILTHPLKIAKDKSRNPYIFRRHSLRLHKLNEMCAHGYRRNNSSKTICLESISPVELPVTRSFQSVFKHFDCWYTFSACFIVILVWSPLEHNAFSEWNNCLIAWWFNNCPWILHCDFNVDYKNEVGTRDTCLLVGLLFHSFVNESLWNILNIYWKIHTHTWCMHLVYDTLSLRYTFFAERISSGSSAYKLGMSLQRTKNVKHVTIISFMVMRENVHEKERTKMSTRSNLFWQHFGSATNTDKWNAKTQNLHDSTRLCSLI